MDEYEMKCGWEDEKPQPEGVITVGKLNTEAILNYINSKEFEEGVMDALKEIADKQDKN